MEIYLIRHAESEMNKLPHLVGGRSNHSPLTDRGRKQAEALGKRLGNELHDFKKVYSSPAIRTTDTARIVCNHLDYSLEEIVVDENLQELSQGIYEGIPRREVYTPEIMNKIKKDTWNFHVPKGESQKIVETRMISFMEDILLPYKYDKTIIFTHGMAIKCFLAGIMDWNRSKTYSVELQNTSITKVEFIDDWKLKCINDYAHIIKTLNNA